MKLVLASGNAGKLAELRDLLGDGFTLHAQSEFGVRDADETGLSFIENAILKARHAARISGLPALGDDSGLCVDAFGGAPGVQSARYAQTSPDDPKSDARNNEKLLAELGNRTERQAHFVTVIVYVRHADDPQPIIAEGEWHGEILAKERGTAGFGYDPLFYLRDLDLTSAELPADEKNRRSHRGQALAKLVERLQARH